MIDINFQEKQKQVLEESPGVAYGDGMDDDDDDDQADDQDEDNYMEQLS